MTVPSFILLVLCAACAVVAWLAVRRVDRAQRQVRTLLDEVKAEVERFFAAGRSGGGGR